LSKQNYDKSENNEPRAAKLKIVGYMPMGLIGSPWDWEKMTKSLEFKLKL